MTLSHITRTLGLVTLLGSSLSALQATELTGLDDLTDDALLGIMRFLPDRDIGAMAVTSRASSEVSRTALFSMISGMTLNRGTGEDHHRLQDLPKSRVHHILGQIAEQDQYLAVPMNSPLCTMMPDTLKLADLEDWRAHLPLAMTLYEAAFGKDFPDDHVDLALQHLLAVIDTRVYVQRNTVDESFAQFAAKKSKDLMETLRNQREARPFVNFLHGDIDGTLLAIQAHTIVLSDAELDQPGTLKKLEKLLASQTPDLIHLMVLSVGNSPARLQDGVLTLRTDDLPSNVRHLTVTNPLGNVTDIENYFLKSHNNLSKLSLLGFQNVTTIGNSFLDGCIGLTSVDLSVLKNVTTIGSSFLSDCHGLISVDLSPFKNVTRIERWFLCNCSGLTSVDLSPFKNVTVIGGSFLSGCSGLTSVDLSVLVSAIEVFPHFLSKCSGLTNVDLSGLTKLEYVPEYFIANCPNLTTEAKAQIIAFCKQRGLEWKPS